VTAAAPATASSSSGQCEAAMREHVLVLGVQTRRLVEWAGG
jgi:hypothetical protein